MAVGVIVGEGVGGIAVLVGGTDVGIIVGAGEIGGLQLESKKMINTILTNNLENDFIMTPQ